jgi:hypothetical protein
MPDAPPAPPCTDDSQCTGALAHCSPAYECVECVQSSHCSGLTPVCDTTTHVCHACTDDAECASSVCNSLTGACLAETEVLYVAPAGAGSSDCARTQPCTLARAIVVAGAGRFTVKMAPGNYDASVVVTSKDLSIHGDGATLTAYASNSALDVQAGAHVQLRGLSLVNQGGDGAIYCGGSPGTPSLDLSRVSVQSDGGTLVVQDCTAAVTASRLISSSASTPNVFAAGSLTIQQTLIDGGNGVLAEGAATLVRITNSLILNQVGSNGPFTGSNLFGSGAGSMIVSFSTVIGSVVKCAQGVPRCAGGTALGSCIDNSIVYAPALNAAADAVQGNCTVKYSLVTPQVSQLAGGNNAFSLPPKFKDSAAGDYRLQAASPAVDTADPAATNAVDYDGIERPQGLRRDMGAFEYQ